MCTKDPKIVGDTSAMVKCPALVALIAKALVEKDLQKPAENQTPNEKEGGHDGSSASGVPANQV